MFNIHSTELILVCVVALVVIGPEKLPMAVKTASLWIGRFRRSFYKVKSEIERELNTDEIRRQLHNESVMAEIEEAKSQVEGVTKDAKESVNKIVNTANFDPGASKESYAADAEEETEGKSLKAEIEGEIKEIGEQVENATKQIYGTGKNPKLATADSPTNKPEHDAS
jgi:sec-independent protein translocase protein TatB